MSNSDGDEVLESFEDLKRGDAAYAKYAERFGPLADFLTEYEHQKGLSGITQAELAARASTSQSAISRFEAMKHPPTYDFLVKLSEALGDRLFLSPVASMSLSLPYDLREGAQTAAERHGVSVQELMTSYIRESLSRESFTVVGRGSAVVTNRSYEMKPGAAGQTYGLVTEPDSASCCEAANEAMAG